MENNDFDKLYNNLHLELSKYLLKIKTCLTLNADVEDLTREKCRKWVEKLSDIQDLNVSTINNHISYAKTMLDMLLKNDVDKPFLDEPCDSALPPATDYTLTSDLEAVFNEELEKYFASNDFSNQSQNLFQRAEGNNMKTDSGFKLEQLNFILTAKQKELENMFIKFEGPTTLKKKKIEKLENKIIMMKERLREELLTMEKIHELKVKQILARKNADVAEQAEKYERKLLELESEKGLLDKKYQLEVKNLLEIKEKEMNDIKRCHEMELKSKEEALVNQLSECHKDKSYHMEKKHEKEMAEFANEMKAKLNSVKECHNKEMQEKVYQIQDLQKKLNNMMALLEKMEKEKKESEDWIASLNKDLDKMRDEKEAYKNDLLTRESEMKHIESDHKLEVKTLKYQSDAFEESLKLKYASSTAKLTERICHIQKLLESKENQLHLLKKEQASSKKLLEKVKELEKSLVSKDEEVRTLSAEQSSQSKDLMQKHLMFVEEIELRHRKELEEINAITEDKIKHYEEIASALKVELNKSDEAQKTTKKNLEEKVERARKQEIELRRERDDLLIKITNFEKELANARTTRLKLEQSQTHKLKKLQNDFQGKISHELQKFKSEKKELQDNVEKMKSSFQKEKQFLLEKHRNAISEMESKLNHKTECDLKIKELLESRIQKIEQEKQESVDLLKRELKELGEKKDEEIKALKNQFQNEFELMHKKSCLAREQIKEHNKEKIRVLSKQHSEKVNRLQMKCEFRVFEAEKVLEKAKSEMQLLEQKNAKQEVEFKERLDSITKQFQGEVDTLNEELKKCYSKFNDLERCMSEKEEALKHCQEHCREQILLLRSDHLNKLKTMVPSSVKEDLEDAIEALRSQVSSLKGRIDMAERHDDDVLQ